MTQFNLKKHLLCLFATALFLPAFAVETSKPEASNMRLVGYNDLQGRTAYQPVIQKQGSR